MRTIFRLWSGWLIAGWLGWTAGTVAAQGSATLSEIVVAICYLQQTGTSHSQLYLYREDGKLLRQLTKDDKAQDTDPIFAPDGETIVFARTNDAGDKSYWSIAPRGEGLRQIAEPGWYAQTKTSSSFGHIFNGLPIVREPRPAPTDARTITTPDQKTKISITAAAGVEDPEAPDKWDVRLETPEGGKETKVGELDGFSAGFLSRSEGDASQCLLQDGTMNVAFCFIHLNSTDGNTVQVLDLNAKRLVPLSHNMASPVPLPGEAAFLTWTETRYVPYGDGEHTANCCYVERWDNKWTPVRYAKDKAAGICLGASIYRPGRTPATVTIRTGEN